MPFLDWLSPSNSLKTRIQNDPYYRFRSLDEIRIAAQIGVSIDVNQATVDDWLRLPGLSIHQARMLTQLSQSGVQFVCVEDIAAALGVSIQRLKPLEPILKFCYYDPDSIYQIKRINLNVASAEELMQIAIVKPVLARAIVRNRNLNGNFKNLIDLQQRLSLTAQTVGQLMHHVFF